MSIRELLKNMSEDTPIPIVINNIGTTFILQSYACGCYVYMKFWNDTINDSLQYEIEENNKSYPSAVVLIRDDCLKQNVVGQVPLHISNTFCHSLELPDCSTPAMVTG